MPSADATLTYIVRGRSRAAKDAGLLSHHCAITGNRLVGTLRDCRKCVGRTVRMQRDWNWSNVSVESKRCAFGKDRRGFRFETSRAEIASGSRNVSPLAVSSKSNMQLYERAPTTVTSARRRDERITVVPRASCREQRPDGVIGRAFGSRPKACSHPKNATNSQVWIKTLIAVSPLRNGLQVEGAIAARIRDGARPSQSHAGSRYLSYQ